MSHSHILRPLQAHKRWRLQRAPPSYRPPHRRHRASPDSYVGGAFAPPPRALARRSPPSIVVYPLIAMHAPRCRHALHGQGLIIIARHLPSSPGPGPAPDPGLIPRPSPCPTPAPCRRPRRRPSRQTHLEPLFLEFSSTASHDVARLSIRPFAGGPEGGSPRSPGEKAPPSWEELFNRQVGKESERHGIRDDMWGGKVGTRGNCSPRQPPRCRPSALGVT